MEKTAEKTKLCSKCGVSFTCLSAEGCWCQDYTIDLETLVKLKKEYEDCLCSRCIGGITR